MNFIDEKILNYCTLNSSPQPKVLEEIERQTYLKQINPRMLSGYLQGNFIKIITKLLKPKKALEIGTFTGYSAICIASALDLDTEFHTIEIDEELETTILSNFEKAGVEKKINLHIGNALQILPQLHNNINFDFVFIDADKENYPEYYNLLKNKINPGGVLITDNVLWSGKVIDEKELQNDIYTKAINLFNQYLRNDNTFDTLILPIRDGISLSVKK